MGLSGPFADAAETLELDETPDVSSDAGTPPAPETDPAPEASAPTTPADTHASAETDEASDFGDGWKVDAKGRLHRAEVEKWKVAHPAPDASAVPAVEDAPVVEAPARVEPLPYVFAGHDKPFIEGALVHPESGDVFIPAAKRDELERLVMRGARYEQYRDERRDALQRAEVAEQRGEAKVGSLVDALPFLHTKEAFMQFVAEVGQDPDRADLMFDRLSLSIERAMDAVDKKFEPLAKPAAASAEGHDTPSEAKPLDRDEATEAFADYFREILALPEFKGMPSELRDELRGALAETNLFVRDADGDWCINERAAARPLAMAKRAMQAATQAVKGREFNAAQATRGAATPAAPPSVSAGKPRAGAPAPSATAAPKDPLINPKTGKRYDNPWDAIGKSPIV